MPTLMTTGAVDFGKEIDSSLLAVHLAVRLRDVDANEIEVRPNHVTFRGGIFRFVTNWNILVSFGFGDFAVDSNTDEIRYRLSYRQLVICSAIMFGVMCLCLLTFSGTQGIISGTWTILGLLLMWFCLGFINVTIGVWRFERFLGRAIATAPRVKPIGAADR
jgi:hypothetical protein